MATRTQRLAEGLGFKSDEREHDIPELSNADVYIEPEPTVIEFLTDFVPTWGGVGSYFYNLFPFLRWIYKYNLTWFMGDLVAGITIGAVVVPQGMSYAQLAELPVEFGLYSSFMGVLIYWFFATSKDITIGPVAVMSQVTGTVVLHAAKVLPDVPGYVIASALAVIAGSIITFLGVTRLGWIVDFIPLPAICAFMTGSALNIASGQVAKLLGISGVNTRLATYLVVIDTLKALPTAKIDAAIGMTALTMLYSIRFACGYMAKKQPSRAKVYFFISTMRTAFVILLYVAISAGVNLHRRENPLFSIIGTVPRGFKHAGAPTITIPIIKAFVPDLPVAVIVMLIEHISISRSFGRINNYIINPSQELVAIGVTNLLGPLLGAYPATGSFSRTAIKSKAGVRTPFAGVITAIVVLLALYALTAVFFYIPNASMAAVIIHAVCDIITPLPVVIQFWRVAPLDVFIFIAGVFVAVFATIEDGVYVTICISFAVVIVRMFLSKGRFIGLARIRTYKAPSAGSSRNSSLNEKGLAAEVSDHEMALRTGFLPLNHEDGTNPNVDVVSPYPGVFIYRFAEGFNYPNAGRYLNDLSAAIFRETRRTDPGLVGKIGDRPWNDNAPRHVVPVEDNRPILRAVVLDCTAVNNVDVTAIQALIDVHNQLLRYAAPEPVDFHFANIQNRWAKRGFAAAGFGYRTQETAPGDRPDNYKTIFSIAELGGSDSAARAASILSKADRKGTAKTDLENGSDIIEQSDEGVPQEVHSSRLVSVQGLNRPYFHFDLQEAVEAAVANVERRLHKMA